MPDFQATNLGTLITLKPLTEAAEAWLAENIDPDSERWCGALAIEPRFFEPIFEAILETGLTF